MIETTGRDGEPVSSPATATAHLGCGGRWLITDFDGTFMGAPFIGHEVLGYDPVARVYILCWTDSTATSFCTGEGEFDAAAATMTCTVHGRDDKTGATATWRQVDIWRNTDHHEWSIRTPGPDGKERVQMTIRYRRRS